MSKEKQEREYSPDQLQDLLERGTQAFKDGQYEQALERFKEAVDADSKSAEAHAWLAAVYGRKISAMWNMMDKIKLHAILESEIAEALELDPSLPLARRMNGARLLNSPDMLGGDPEAAVEEFLYCMKEGMDDAEVWVSLAECYMKTEEKDKAERAIQEALARDPQHSKALELRDALS